MVSPVLRAHHFRSFIRLWNLHQLLRQTFGWCLRGLVLSIVMGNRLDLQWETISQWDLFVFLLNLKDCHVWENNDVQTGNMIDPHWGPVVYYIYRLSFFYRAKIQANHVRPLQWSFLLFFGWSDHHRWCSTGWLSHCTSKVCQQGALGFFRVTQRLKSNSTCRVIKTYITKLHIILYKKCIWSN